MEGQETPAYSNRSSTISSGFHPSEKLSLSHENDVDVRHGYAISVCNVHSERFILGSLISLHGERKGS